MTRADGTRRREAILDAALSCFAKRGVLGTGIEEIRRRSKASPSSVYHLFPPANGGNVFEAVLLALLERTFARLFGHLAARICSTRTAEAAVKRLVEAQIEWVVDNAAEARVMYQAMTLESRAVMPALAKKKAVLLEPVVSHFGKFIAEGTLPRWNPLVFDVVLLGATHEACRRWLGGAALEPRWMKRELPRLAWASID